MHTQPGGQFPQGVPLPGGLLIGDDGFFQLGRRQCREQRRHGVRQVVPCVAQHPCQQACQRAERRCNFHANRRIGVHFYIVFLPPGHFQAVVDQGFGRAGKHIVAQRLQRHGRADQPQPRCRRHGQRRENAQHTAENQRAPPPQQIRSHAAGHLAQQARQMEHPFGQADFRQREAPRRQQRHPDGIGKPQCREKCVQIHAAQLFL